MISRLVKELFSFIFICFTLQMWAQHKDVFYIGHSLSDQIPDMVKSLSGDHPSVSMDWVYQSIPGSPLRWQWGRKEAMDYDPIHPNYYGFYDPMYGLPSGNYAALVLTESVPRYWSIIQESYDYTDSLYLYATQYRSDTKVYIYESWHCLLSGSPTSCEDDIESASWRQRLDDDLPMWESMVDHLNETHDPVQPACLIPGGQAMARLYDSIQAKAIPGLHQIEDVFSDNIHLNDTGKYFMACVHFTSIMEESPIGLTNQLYYWWGGAFDPPPDTMAIKLQEIAYEAVLSYPHACYSMPTLSVKQIDLESSIDNGKIKAKWNTHSDSNILYYTLLWSTDNKNWQSGSSIKAKGKGNNNYSYSFFPSQEGIYYLKLRYISIDGSKNESDIIKVNIALSRKNKYLYPNPVHQVLYLEGNVGPSVIVDLYGRIVLKSSQKKIDVSGLHNGVYLIRTNRNVLKFIKI